MKTNNPPQINNVFQNINAEVRENGSKYRNDQHTKSKLGLIVAGGIGAFGVFITALATPFVLPALRKHCLPYVPATDSQLSNLAKAFKRHSQQGGSFIDIGSGDGRICRMVANSSQFSQVHGVELNYLLVIFSRIMALKGSQHNKPKYFHRDLWKFPLANYDTMCIFGVESMMTPLEEYIIRCNSGNTQTIVACRFPFPNLSKVDEIGSGIDTVWVYKVK